MPSFPTRHSMLTRLSHMGLALAVMTQLLTSLVFVAPSPDRTGNLWYDVHEFGGLAAFGFVTLFWLALTARRVGTSVTQLFPWFSDPGIQGVWADTKAHIAALTRFRIPPNEEYGPLASAVHGLGLLLVTAMAVTGTIYYFLNTGNPDAGGVVGILMFVHKTLANVVWIYLIGHSGLAIVHHYTQNMSLTDMWSFKRG